MNKIILLILCLTYSHLSNAQSEFSNVYKKYIQAAERKDHQATLQYAKQAVELGQGKFAAGSENLLNLKYNLAIALGENRKQKEALQVFEEIEPHYADLYGNRSAEYFQFLIDEFHFALNKVIYHGDPQRNKSKAKSKFKTLVKISSQLTKEGTPERAVYQYNIAKTAFAGPLVNMMFRKVFKIVKSAEEELLASFGETDARTMEVQFMLAKFHAAKNKKRTAIQYFETVINTIDNELKTSHPYELASHASLVELYETKGDSEQATEHCIAIGNMTPWNDDIDPTPLYRKNPAYPSAMARLKRDGWVKLRFDIDTFGFVKNVELIDSDGGEGFVDEAKKALEKWRYAPKFIDGEAVVAKGQRVQLDFKIG